MINLRNLFKPKTLQIPMSEQDRAAIERGLLVTATYQPRPSVQEALEKIAGENESARDDK
jgi:hypothetical protein